MKYPSNIHCSVWKANHVFQFTDIPFWEQCYVDRGVQGFCIAYVVFQEYATTTTAVSKQQIVQPAGHPVSHGWWNYWTFHRLPMILLPHTQISIAISSRTCDPRNKQITNRAKLHCCEICFSRCDVIKVVERSGYPVCWQVMSLR